MHWLEGIGAEKVDIEVKADFVISHNNGVYAIYPKEEIKQSKPQQGPYWIECGKCFTFTDRENKGCIFGDIQIMKQLLKGKKVIVRDGIWSSMYVPFSNCGPEGCTGTECITRKIGRILKEVVEKPEEIKQEIFRERLIEAAIFPETKEELKKKFGENIAEFAVIPGNTLRRLIEIIERCQFEQKFKLNEGELLRYL